MKKGTLYLISTPIGNLEDVTSRALRYFKELPTFYAEDTREFLQLLRALSIEEKKEILSYASHNLKETTEAILSRLELGEDIGLVTDRGTPAISDPGASLVKGAREKGYPVVAIPGVSSLSTAISLSGVEGVTHHFWGFVEKKERKSVFEKIQNQLGMHYFFESPKRTLSFLDDFETSFPGKRLFIAKELTKLFEKAGWFEVSELRNDPYFEKGEFVLAILVSESKEDKEEVLEDWLKLRTCSDKEWAKEAAHQFSLSVTDLYNKLQLVKKRN